MREEKDNRILLFIKKCILIRKSFLYIGFIVGAVAVFSSPSLCGEGLTRSEKTKILEIFKEMKYSRNSQASSPSASECEAISQGLREGKDYEILEPIVWTNDYQDPKLQSYIGKCTDLKLNKNVSYEPKIWDYVQGLAPEEREKFSMVRFATADFKLYHVDINGKFDDDMYIFYGGGVYYPKRATQNGSSSVYKLADLQTCKVVTSIVVSETIKYSTKERTGNFNGVIKHKYENYVFDIGYFEDTKSYGITIYKLMVSNSMRKSLNQVCNYSTSKNGGMK